MRHSFVYPAFVLAALSAVSLRPPADAPCAPGAPVLFEGATVLTMTDDAPLRGTSVLVSAGRIASIDPPSVPANACRIAAAGKVLMPGLSDIHVHTDESEMPLFLANGVTLVREMNGTPRHLALRDRIAAGEVVGPTMLVTSPLLVGAPLRNVRFQLITAPEEARRLAREYKRLGYDYLKIYDGLSRPVYDALVEEGRELHLPLDGHIPADVGLAAVLEAGQSIQHADKLAFALARHTADTMSFAEARRLFRGRGAWFTPTLASLRVLDGAGTSEYAARLTRPELAYVDSASLGWWRSLAGERSKEGPSAFFRFEAALVPLLRESGARLLLGTDAANPMMVAGFSVHDELESLVRDGGLTREEALRTATRNVGDFLGDSLRGRIVPGAVADLLLVDGDPREELSTLRTPIGVMSRGRWFERSALDSMLASARRPD